MKLAHPGRARVENCPVVVIQIHLRSETELAQVAHVLHDPRSLLNAGVCRNRDRGEHRDDDDDDKKFDQRKTTRARCVSQHDGLRKAIDARAGTKGKTLNRLEFA